MTMPLILSLIAALSGGGIELPDPSEGQIDGKVALLFWPHGPGKKLLSPAGCETHLVPLSDPDQELVYPCGEWFQPPPDRYRGWLEQGDAMTPSPWITSYGGSRFKTGGLTLVAPVLPAGRVRTPFGRSLDEGRHLRLVHVDSHRFEGGFGRLMNRRVPGKKASSGARMPAGGVVAGIFDGDQAVALARPVLVKAGETSEVWPQPPSRGSDVLVVLDRTVGATADDSTPLLLVEEEIREPDVLISGFDGIIAVWYGLEAPAARLRVSSESSFLPEERLTLRVGKVTTYRGRLQVRPSLGVRVVAPDDFDEEVEVEIEAAGVSRTVPAVLNDVTEVERVPAAPLRVTLKAGKWRFLESVDLSDGNDRSVSFELKPVRVSGSVLRGRKPAAGAEVGFQVQKGEVVSSETDAGGEYQIVLWREAYYPVLITLRDVTGPPVFDFVQVVDGARLDFELPDNEYRVQVLDGATGTPIPDARVRVEQRSGLRETSQSVVTDSDGTVILPPLGEGTLTLAAKAAGFRESPSQQFPIGSDSGMSEVVIRLEREQEAEQLRILFSTGAPAGGAEAWLVADGALVPFWEGTAEPDGSLRLPAVEAAAVLLIRHSGAGSIARRVPGAGPEQILPPASPPLRLRVERRGGMSARSAAVGLLLEDARLFGPPLAFFAWSTALVDGSGIWTGRNLPPQPLRVLSWTATASAAQLGSFDAMAASIAYPWPSEVAIVALE